MTKSRTKTTLGIRVVNLILDKWPRPVEVVYNLVLIMSLTDAIGVDLACTHDMSEMA